MKILYIILMLVFSLGMGGCNYVDIEPVGKVIPDETDEYRALLTSAYSSYPQYRRLLMVRSDEVFPDFYGLSFDNYIDLATLNDENPDPVTEVFPWTSAYKIIFYANSVIEGVMKAKADGSTDTREQLLAEAYCLRAFVHFDLMNLYAKWYDPETAPTDKAIPLSLKVDIGQAYVPATVEQVYEQIFADLKEAEKYMQTEEQTGTFLYRFSGKSLKALKARVYLYHQDWQLAQETAEEILVHCPLEDLVNEEVHPWTYTSKEAILSLESVSSTTMKEDMYVLDNIAGKFNQVQEGDKYADARVGNYLVNKYGTWYCNKGGNKNEKVTFRSAEIYLIAAEAAAHREGQLAVAKNYLLELLKYRLTENYYQERKEQIEAMNQEQLLADILDERARELAFEGHRWFDIRRTVRPEVVKTYTDADWNLQTVIIRKDDPKYIIPYPQEAIENNPDLKR